MLVLSRRTNDCIHIGDDIIITVLGVEGDKVKIGISAPLEIKILRGEVFDAVQAQDKIKVLLEEGPEPDTFKNLRELLSEELSIDEVNPSLAAEEMPVQKE